MFLKWMRSSARLCLFLSFSLWLQGCASAPPPRTERIEAADYAYVKEYTSWLVGQEMKRHDVVGLSIALVDDQQVVWAQGFGYADQAKGVLRPNPPGPGPSCYPAAAHDAPSCFTAC